MFRICRIECFKQIRTVSPFWGKRGYIIFNYITNYIIINIYIYIIIIIHIMLGFA